MEAVTISGVGVPYQRLNEEIREALQAGCTELVLKGVNGQRYIGAGLQRKARLKIYGTPGNNLGAMSEGLFIRVHGNGQDGIANTMSGGTIIVDGHATDILGYAMRGGEVFVRGDVGYRVGIHMKSYGEKQPVIVVGGRAGDYLGEYMAGGRIVVLGLDSDSTELTGSYVGTGMHGGTIYVRGEVPEYRLGREVAQTELEKEDREFLAQAIERYCHYFDLKSPGILPEDFTKLSPVHKRPYGQLYAY